MNFGSNHLSLLTNLKYNVKLHFLSIQKSDPSKVVVAVLICFWDYIFSISVSKTYTYQASSVFTTFFGFDPV